MSCCALTYKGPSARFEDPTTGLTWEVGTTHEVSEADAERLTTLTNASWHSQNTISTPDPVKEETDGD